MRSNHHDVLVLLLRQCFHRQNTTHHMPFALRATRLSFWTMSPPNLSAQYCHHPSDWDPPFAAKRRTTVPSSCDRLPWISLRAVEGCKTLRPMMAFGHHRLFPPDLPVLSPAFQGAEAAPLDARSNRRAQPLLRGSGWLWKPFPVSKVTPAFRRTRPSDPNKLTCPRPEGNGRCKSVMNMKPTSETRSF